MFSFSQKRPRSGPARPVGRTVIFAMGVVVMIASPSARTLGQGAEVPSNGDDVRAALSAMAADLVAQR